LEMAAILKILKVDCTLLSHPPHPQKFSFGLVEGFNPWSNYANPTTDVFGNNGAIFKLAAILKLSKTTKNVNDNYPLQSGHKITTTGQVSTRLNKNASLRGGMWLNGRHFKMASFAIDFFSSKYSG
jgi:hypothetical protein